jgi:hypothetical protein
MTYPSHYAPGSYGIASPNAKPYAVLDRALTDAKRRSARIPKAGEIVPWYQDFTLGPPRYGPTHVRAQIQAGYDNGIRSWMLWNPRSAYTVAALRPAILEEAAERVRKPAPPPAADSTARRDSAPPAVTAPAAPSPRPQPGAARPPG